LYISGIELEAVGCNKKNIELFLYYCYIITIIAKDVQSDSNVDRILSKLKLKDILQNCTKSSFVKDI
jgi:hypothetical protein